MSGARTAHATINFKYTLQNAPIPMKRSSRRWKKKRQMRWKWQRKKMKKEKRRRARK